MKTIGQAINSQKLNASESPTDCRRIHQFLLPEHMQKLWETLSRIYGRKWTGIATSDDGTWLEGLRGISPKQVASAIGKLVATHIEWPPSLPEFRRLCLDIDYDDFERHIEKIAFSGLDSYYINQLTYKERDRLKDRARDRAMADYIQSLLISTADENLKLLEHTNERK